MVLVKDFVDIFDGSVDTQEKFITLKEHLTTEDAFKDKTFSEFWITTASL